MSHPAIAEGMSYKKSQEFRESDAVREFVLQAWLDAVPIYKIHRVASLHFKVPIGQDTARRIINKKARQLNVDRKRKPL